MIFILIYEIVKKKMHGTCIKIKLKNRYPYFIIFVAAHTTINLTTAKTSDLLPLFSDNSWLPSTYKHANIFYNRGGHLDEIREHKLRKQVWQEPWNNKLN
jgi:hypothetical protein